MAKKKAKGKKKKAKGKPFGGYVVCFKGVKDSLEQVFGKKPIAPSAMTKVLWAYIKKKKLLYKK